MFARIGLAEFAEGMLTDRGRIVSIGPTRVASGDTVSEADLDGASIDLSDRATFWLALDIVARRTGLDTRAGLLWSLQDDPFGDENLAWVLESDEESRTRPHDTDDPLESLAKALEETVGSGSAK